MMPIFTHVTHDELLALVSHLADAIRADSAPPTLLVGIGRGGLVPAVYLSHATGLPMRSIDYSAQDDALLGDIVTVLARSGERLLFIDDINDSGRTIAALRDLLAAAGARDVRFATLIDNTGSAQRVDVAARTIDRAVTKDWFVFPWEAVAPDSAIAADAAEVPDRIA